MSHKIERIGELERRYVNAPSPHPISTILRALLGTALNILLYLVKVGTDRFNKFLTESFLISSQWYAPHS